MAADVSSEEEYHSAPEGEEVERASENRIQSAVSEDKADQRLKTQLDGVDIKDDDDRMSQSHSVEACDGGLTDRGSKECDSQMLSGLDNRYVSEEHAPETDGAVELTEEQIKVKIYWQARSSEIHKFLGHINAQAWP